MTARSTPPAGPEIDRGLPKAPTGIEGLDEITGGGLPRGRPTLVCGGPGCGKTLLATEFLVRGAVAYGEPGVLMAFEETAHELARNAASLGFDLDDLRKRKLLAIDHVRVERSEIEEAGEYDLEGLFIRLGHAIDSIGAKRVVLDTLEVLFGGFSNTSILRAELRRLFAWLKDKGVTAIITAERGDGTLSRQGLEEYVSDCVLLLDHRVIDQLSTRRMRIVKYRGSSHGTSEYPFLIDDKGISVLPLSSAKLDHTVSAERISSGIPRLDAMLGGAGYFVGSSILISGTAGVGKSTFAAHLLRSSCAAGRRCLMFAFEESPDQIVRNMRSVGIDLEEPRKAGRLQIHSARPSLFGLEMHLLTMNKAVREFRPSVVIIDPISNFISGGSSNDVRAMLVRLVDFLKSEHITALFTNLTSGGEDLEATESGLSSIVDTWILLRDIELGGERNRALYVLKSRGMAHSNQIREFVLGSNGIDLNDVYVGPEGVLTGSMRLAQEAREVAAKNERLADFERRERVLARRKQVVEAQILALQSELAAEEEELQRFANEQQDREQVLMRERERMAIRRGSDARKVDPQNTSSQRGRPK